MSPSSDLKVVDIIHNVAMDLLFKDELARKSGDLIGGQRYVHAAMVIESAAANCVNPDIQPSYSILWAGAASLAFNAGQYDTSREYAEKALHGGAPQFIVDEMNELLTDLNQKTT